MEPDDADRLREMEAAAWCHWQSYREACKAEGIDDVTFLASLAANITQLLEEFPEYAEAWLNSILERVREERRLLEQEPS